MAPPIPVGPAELRPGHPRGELRATPSLVTLVWFPRGGLPFFLFFLLLLFSLLFGAPCLAPFERDRQPVRGLALVWAHLRPRAAIATRARSTVKVHEALPCRC